MHLAPALGTAGGAAAGGYFGGQTGAQIGAQAGGQLGSAIAGPQQQPGPLPPAEPLMHPNIPNIAPMTPGGGSSAPVGNLAASLAPAAMKLNLPMNAGQSVALQRILALLG